MDEVEGAADGARMLGAGAGGWRSAAGAGVLLVCREVEAEVAALLVDGAGDGDGAGAGAGAPGGRSAPIDADESPPPPMRISAAPGCIMPLRGRAEPLSRSVRFASGATLERPGVMLGMRLMRLPDVASLMADEVLSRRARLLFAAASCSAAVEAAVVDLSLSLSFPFGEEAGASASRRRLGESGVLADGPDALAAGARLDPGRLATLGLKRVPARSTRDDIVCLGLSRGTRSQMQTLRAFF